MKNTIKNPLFWIFLLALILRIYKLDKFPVGFHVDEVKVGWNALSILNTGKDDHLKTLSLYYDSFGDFRPTGIFYFTIPSIFLFGRSVFATRFATALFGALMVLPIYLLINLLWEKNKNHKINAGLWGAFFLAISPWNIELSRATNEAVISTFFALFSIYFLIKLILSGKLKYGTLSGISIFVSYLHYHPIRLLAPILFTITAVFYFKKIIGRKVKTLVLANILITVLLTAYFGLAGQGLSRFNQTSIIGSVDTRYELERLKSDDASVSIVTKVLDNKYITYTKRIINEYGNYFSSDFLLGNSAKPYRFSTPGIGLLTYMEVFLILLGLTDLIRGKKNFLPFLFLIIAPLPAAVTFEDSPNLSRAFLMNPFFIMIAALGACYLINYFKSYKNIIAVFLTFLMIANFSYFAWMYTHHSFNHRPFVKDYFVDSPTYRNVGAIELAKELDLLSKKYDKVIITNFPDNVYPWYAFLTDKSPGEFNKTYQLTTKERDWNNIIFSEEKCPSDDDFWKYYDQNILVVDSWECGYESQIKAGSPMKVLSKITRRDGTEVYILLERDPSKEFPKDIRDKIRQISKK